MKIKFLFSAICIVSLIYNSYATVRTVSNNTFSPGQYTNLQVAIDSANAGDSIYVEPSPYDYGSITIQKQLYLFGGGGDPYTYQVNFNTTVDNVTFSSNSNYPYNNPDGSVFQGFYLTYPSTIGVTAGMKNITIERNFTVFNVTLTGPDTGIVIVNNIFANSYYINLNGANPNDITALIANNFFAASNNGSTTEHGDNQPESGVIFTNNIFLGNNIGASNQGTFFSGVYDVTVKNNIFYGDGGYAQSFSSGCSGCVFQNNITYSPNTNEPNGNQTLPDAGNTGTGNINNTNPAFTNGPAVYTYANAALLYNYNWALTAGSPGHNAGTDGTDIGIYGGPFPMPNLEAVTRLPQVRQLNILNPAVAPNGTLNVNFIGTTRN